MKLAKSFFASLLLLSLGKSTFLMAELQTNLAQLRADLKVLQPGVDPRLEALITRVNEVLEAPSSDIFYQTFNYGAHFRNVVNALKKNYETLSAPEQNALTDNLVRLLEQKAKTLITQADNAKAAGHGILKAASTIDIFSQVLTQFAPLIKEEAQKKIVKQTTNDLEQARTTLLKGTRLEANELLMQTAQDRISNFASNVLARITDLTATAVDPISAITSFRNDTLPVLQQAIKSLSTVVDAIKASAAPSYFNFKFVLNPLTEGLLDALEAAQGLLTGKPFKQPGQAAPQPLSENYQKLLNIYPSTLKAKLNTARTAYDEFLYPTHDPYPGTTLAEARALFGISDPYTSSAVNKAFTKLSQGLDTNSEAFKRLITLRSWFNDALKARENFEQAEKDVKESGAAVATARNQLDNIITAINDITQQTRKVQKLVATL